MLRSFGTTILIAVLMQSSFAQSSGQTGQPSQSTTIQAGTNEVVLDLTARDKKGRLVTDLKPEDIEVFDNGQKRSLSSFQLIEGRDAFVSDAQHAAGSTQKQLNPLQQVRLVSLIFNRLDLNARQLARKAALDLLKTDLPQNVYMAVLVLGDRLEGLQSFTNDRELLRKAIARATSGAYNEFVSDTQRVQQELQQSLGPNGAGQGAQERINSMSTGGGGTGAAGAPNGGAAATQAMAQMMLNMLQLNQRSELAQTGRAAVFGLLGVVEQQYRLPGRKSILFFSEGFSVPQGMEEPFRTVVSTANRFNVTFYSIDARGLGTTNLNDESVSELKDAVAASRSRFGRGHDGVTPAEAGEFDTAINSGKANTQNTVAELASETGGFLIANTNDFRDPLRRITEDIETYYQVTYNPGIEKYDGSFRKIEVRTPRSGVRLLSRAGYFALPPSTAGTGEVLSPDELPLLKALDTKPLPHTFGFQSAALHFQSAGREPVCSVVLDLPLGNLSLEKNQAGTRYQGDFGYVVLVKDSQGEVLKKFHGTVPVAGTAEQFQALKESHFIYTQHFDLPPGRYTLETAVLDRQAEKVSVRKSVFLMPSAGPQLSISSPSLVRSVRNSGSQPSDEDPFAMAGKTVTPSLSSVEKNSSPQGLSFYVVVYPDQSNKVKPELLLQFNRDGQPLGGGAAPLGEPDAHGRIQYVATAPIAKLDPGNYQLRFMVKQGTESTEESITFTLN